MREIVVRAIPSVDPLHCLFQQPVRSADKKHGTRVAIRTWIMAHPTRLRSFEYVGYWRYLATTCAYKRRPLFREASIVTSSLDQILQASVREKCEVLAYCFMPDHVHLLIAGEDGEADFERFMKLAKQRAGWRHSQDTGHRLWQPGYHERVLRADEATPDVIRYMVANPVQAGLVTKPEDYPYWGSATHSRGEILEFIATVRQT